MNDDANENNADNYRIYNSKTVTSESFEYKLKIIGGTSINNNTLYTGFVVPLKCFSNFRRSLSLTNYEIDLDFPWSKDCLIPEISRKAVMFANLPALAEQETSTTSATFQINTI